MPVTERTLRRDVDALTLAGFPIDVKTRRGCQGRTKVVLDRSIWNGGERLVSKPVRTH